MVWYLDKHRDFFTFNLTLPLYGSETWSLTLNEAQRLRVLENRVLRRIFGPNGECSGRMEKTA
jgi:hypothetical protein